MWNYKKKQTGTEPPGSRMSIYCDVNELLDRGWWFAGTEWLQAQVCAAQISHTMARLVFWVLVQIQSVCAIFNINGMMNKFGWKEVKIRLLNGWCWCLENVFLIEWLSWWTFGNSLGFNRKQTRFECFRCCSSCWWICKWIIWIISRHHLRWRRWRFAWRSWGYWIGKWMCWSMGPNRTIDFDGASRCLWGNARLWQACKLLAADLAFGTVFFDELPFHSRSTLKEMHR